jgi:uncharacterized protein (UPF0332 family)
VSLHRDLLDQATLLAQVDLRRPKQANLRRAVSSAYYALFHLLTSEASGLYAVETGLAARINRTLNHGEMKKVSQSIANHKLPKALSPPGGGYVTPADVRTVADAFVNLQQARHEADYDLSRTFTRKEALMFMQTAHQAFHAWENVNKTDDARMYLACFQLWKRWDEDPR